MISRQLNFFKIALNKNIKHKEKANEEVVKSLSYAKSWKEISLIFIPENKEGTISKTVRVKINGKRISLKRSLHFKDDLLFECSNNRKNPGRIWNTLYLMAYELTLDKGGGSQRTKYADSEGYFPIPQKQRRLKGEIERKLLESFKNVSPEDSLFETKSVKKNNKKQTLYKFKLKEIAVDLRAN